MNKHPLSDEIALCISQVASEFPDITAAQLLKVWADAAGLPPTPDSLIRPGIKRLKAAIDKGLTGSGHIDLKAALRRYMDEVGIPLEVLPEPDAFKEGDMPDSIRVAIASNQVEQLDGHFGSCRRFLIYQISSDEIRLIDLRATTGFKTEADKNALRAELIGDCHILCVVSIGGPAAAKIVKNNIHPIKYPRGGDTRKVLSDLQRILSNSPPPWLAKEMGHSPQQCVRFKNET